MSKIKKYDEHRHLIKLEEYKKKALLLKQSSEVCNKISKTKKLSDLQDWLNKKTGFVNAKLSASALGFETEYDLLIDIQNKIGDTLSTEDLDENYNLKKNFLSTLRDEYTTYFTEEEEEVLKKLNKVIDLYNSISFNYRVNIGINRESKLQFYPNANILR